MGVVRSPSKPRRTLIGFNVPGFRGRHDDARGIHAGAAEHLGDSGGDEGGRVDGYDSSVAGTNRRTPMADATAAGLGLTRPTHGASREGTAGLGMTTGVGRPQHAADVGAYDGPPSEDGSDHPWVGSFISGTALLVAALVVLGSMASPWPANDAGVTFTLRLMKRLACVWVAKQTAAWLLHRLLRPAVGRTAEVAKHVVRACRGARAKFDANRRGILLIPVVAAFVGWVTNWLAVKMIFYPIAFFGVPMAQMVEGEMYGYNILNPLGWVGWQGIVPAKAAQMAHTMVTMVTTKLVDVQEVFQRLDPRTIARLLSGEVPEMVRGIAKDMAPGWAVDLGERALPGAPGPLRANLEGAVRRYLAGFTVMLQEQVHRVVDLKELVVTAMCEDKRTIVELFQRCGREELKFLTNSGLFFGFLLGLVQMAVWLFYDNPWTLTIGGTIVGYLTNWLALKCIFEPVDPVYLFNGKLKIQGLFLQRQLEVSGEFSDHLASKVLTSEKIWDNMLTGRKGAEFEAALREYTREFLAKEAAYQGRGGLGPVSLEDPAVVDAVVAQVKARLSDHVHVLHEYTDDTLGLKELMREKMALMTPHEFERVLHPIFEQDEITLIISGAVLGAIAGFIQQVYTVAADSKGEAEKGEAQGGNAR